MGQTFSKLMAQHNENEMVLKELKLLDDESKVYKLVGPVLLSQVVPPTAWCLSMRRKPAGLISQCCACLGAIHKNPAVLTPTVAFPSRDARTGGGPVLCAGSGRGKNYRRETSAVYRRRNVVCPPAPCSRLSALPPLCRACMSTLCAKAAAATSLLHAACA